MSATDALPDEDQPFEDATGYRPAKDNPDLFAGKSCLTNLAIALCLGLSVFQIYIVNFQALNISLFWLTCFVVMPLALSGSAPRFWLMWLCGGLITLQTLSLLWSPSWLIGVNDTLSLMAFGVMLAFGLKQGADDWGGLITLLRLYCLIAVVQSVLVIALRIDSQAGYHLTSAFLRGDLAKLFFEPNILTGFLAGDGWGADVNPHGLNTSGGIYNVFGAEKAGGFELNGNIAGAWGGLLTFLSLGVFDRERPWRSGAIVLIHAASIIASGSKASLLLMAAAPLIVAFIRFGPTSWAAWKPWQIGVTFGLIALAVLAWVMRAPLMHLFSNHNDYANATLNASRGREFLISHAVNAMRHDWLWGHGFGGWVKTYVCTDAMKGDCPPYKLPPHNTLILIWSQSGLAALICALGILGLALKSTIGLLRGPRGDFAMAALTAFLFAGLQAMGENINIFTSLHISAPLGLIIGMCASQGLALKAETDLKAAAKLWVMGERRSGAGLMNEGPLNDRRAKPRGSIDRRR